MPFNLKDALDIVRPAMTAMAETRNPPVCAECGVYRSDPPSKLCPGCQAYREHQS